MQGAPTGKRIRRVNVTEDDICAMLARDETTVLDHVDRILDSLSGGDGPPTPESVYNRLVVALGPLGWLVAQMLSKTPDTTASMLDEIEDYCVRAGVDRAVILKFRDIIARYYTKLHPVMATVPMLLEDFYVYPDKKLGALRVTLHMNYLNKVSFLITRDDAEQLVGALKWALKVLEAGDRDGEDEDGGGGREIPPGARITTALKRRSPGGEGQGNTLLIT